MHRAGWETPKLENTPWTSTRTPTPRLQISLHYKLQANIINNMTGKELWVCICLNWLTLKTQPLQRCWLNHFYHLRASAPELCPMLIHACPARYSSTANPWAWAIILEMTQLQARTSQPSTPPSLSSLLLQGKTQHQITVLWPKQEHIQQLSAPLIN